MADRGAIMVAVVAQALRGERNRGPRRRANTPDIDEVIRRGQAKLKSLLPKGVGGWKAGILIALVLLGIWAANGFYRVQPNQEGVPVLLGDLWGYNKSRLTLELAGTNW